MALVLMGEQERGSSSIVREAPRGPDGFPQGMHAIVAPGGRVPASMGAAPWGGGAPAQQCDGMRWGRNRERADRSPDA
jgi:hypothetical protein